MIDLSVPKIGVLAIQGDYQAHASALRECGASPSLVRRPGGLDSLDGLIIPGGESTTMLRFLDREDFFEVLKRFVHVKPVFGTCAGAILLAKDVRNPAQKSLKALDIAIERNAYGAQRDSAILRLETSISGGELEAVFIRAPRIVQVGSDIDVLAERDGFPVLIREGKMMAATFHPELSLDRRVHRLFVETVQRSISETA